MNTTTSNDFMSQLLDTFRGEAEEHYKAIVAGLLDLEHASTPDEQAPLLEATFREAHSLKGAARAVGQIDIEAVCQSLEGVFARLKRKELLLSSDVLDPLHRALNTVEALLSDPEGRHATQVAEAIDELSLLEEQEGQGSVSQDIDAMDDIFDFDDLDDLDDLDGVLEADQADAPVEATYPVVVKPSSAEVPETPAVEPPTAEATSEESPQAGLPNPADPPAQPVRSGLLDQSPDFLDKLRAAFQVEADEHLKAIVAGLLDLEQISIPEEQTPILETIFREAHSLKGAARSVNLTDIETVCKALEDVLAHLKRGSLSLSQTLFDTLHRSLDTVQALLTSSDEGQHLTQVAEAVNALTSIYSSAEAQLVGVQPTASATPVEPTVRVAPLTNGTAHPGQPKAGSRPEGLSGQTKAATAETIRVSTAKLDSLLLQTEEMLAVKQTIGERAAELREVLFNLNQWKKEWTKTSPDARKVQRLYESSTEQQRREHTHLPLAAKLVEFLYWSEQELGMLEGRLKGLTRSAEQDHKEVGTMVNNLLEDTKKVLMLPFLSLLDMFPKMVRDLSRTLDKEVDLNMRGSEVEIDKRILEELKDPLIHLLRNSVDHGVEMPAVRQQQGKPARGTISLSISQVSASTVEVLLSDDGAGIDHTAVKKAAVQRGVISAQEAETLDEQAALALIFQSDVSTSPIVTDLSGRGLGMAIVREKVEKLGGQISIDTTLQEGTTFRILLPLTLATFRGINVQAGGQTFVIPTANVERIVRIRQDEIKTVEDKETFLLQGQPVALTHLDAVLGLPRKEKASAERGFQLALVLGTGEKRLAFCVDAILTEQEALFKSLGSYLPAVRNVAGATVLGSGKVVPILHVPDLLQSAVDGTAAAARVSAVAGETEAEVQSVLVAEDSVTSRMLLKGILESAGYQVTTAIDGLDAFTLLKRGRFDLVVSDVEMPRMNGFELTAQIRSDEQCSQVPVVLVTGLESEADRERGITAGANAYLVKGSFDHSNLLDAVQRLL